jgi:hypothetical protein
MAFQQLNEPSLVSEEPMTSETLAQLRDSLIGDHPSAAVPEMLKSRNPRDTIMSMDLVRVTLPDSHDILIRQGIKCTRS